MQTQKKGGYCFYKITFLRKKAKLSVYSTDEKTNSYQSQSLVHKACTRNQSLFCKKHAFQNTVFFSLKMSAQAKKNWHGMFLKIFQVSADEEMGE